MPDAETKVRCRSDSRITVDVHGTVTVTLTVRDIEHWFDNCMDKQTICYLAKYARERAKAMDTMPDDFRSRA